MSSKKIEREIADLQKRREALAFDAATAQRDLEDARKGLVSGKAKAPQVASAQSTFTALSETLLALDQTITATRARLDEARSEEQRAADVVRVREIGEEKARLTGEVQAIFERANEALTEAVAAYTERTTRWVELTREMDAITERRTGFDPSRQRSSPLSDLQLAPVLPFDPAVALALNIESRRRERQRSKEASGRATERERQRQRAA
jgi:hypothetical protein